MNTQTLTVRSQIDTAADGFMPHPEDALGAPIVMGASYGYSTNSNGITTVVVGILENITKEKVTLHVTMRKYFLYGKPTHRAGGGRTVSVTSCNLFPVKRI